MNLILDEKNDFLVINKPAGILSQSDKSGDEEICGLLKRLFPERFSKNDFLAPCHRLDRNTSGLLLLAKNPNAAAKIGELIQSKAIKRAYLAVVKGDPGREGSFKFNLEKNEATNEVRVAANGKAAETQFKKELALGSCSLVEVQLLTGRSHQIRVHFAHAGHGLIGDRKYSKKPWSEIFSRPALHAYRLELPEEIGKKSWWAPIPLDMHALLIKLGAKGKELKKYPIEILD